jgi:hypothetical protein
MNETTGATAIFAPAAGSGLVGEPNSARAIAETLRASAIGGRLASVVGFCERGWRLKPLSR